MIYNLLLVFVKAISVTARHPSGQSVTLRPRERHTIRKYATAFRPVHRRPRRQANTLQLSTECANSGAIEVNSLLSLTLSF